MPWSPRAGHGVVSQWYAPAGYHSSSLRERIVLIAGYGGWLPSDPLGRYDGMRCRSDVWTYSLTYLNKTDSYNRTQLKETVAFNGSYQWQLLTDAPAFGPRAWFGLTVWYGSSPREDISPAFRQFNNGPRMWLVGGGYMGADGANRGSRQVNKIEGRVDSYWSLDGVTWYRTNFQQGGIGQLLPLWSSSDWSRFQSGTVSFYGIWGLSLVTFNSTSFDKVIDNSCCFYSHENLSHFLIRSITVT